MPSLLFFLSLLWVSPVCANSGPVMPLDAHTRLEFVKNYKIHVRELRAAKQRNPLWRSLAAKLAVEDSGYDYSQTFIHYLLDEDMRNKPEAREVWAVVIWANGTLDAALKQKIISRAAYDVAMHYRDVQGINRRNITFLEALSLCLNPEKSESIGRQALNECWQGRDSSRAKLLIPEKNELSQLMERKILNVTSKPSLKMAGNVAPSVVSGKLEGVTVVFHDSYGCNDLAHLKKLIKQYKGLMAQIH